MQITIPASGTKVFPIGGAARKGHVRNTSPTDTTVRVFYGRDMDTSTDGDYEDVAADDDLKISEEMTKPTPDAETAGRYFTHLTLVNTDASNIAYMTIDIERW